MEGRVGGAPPPVHSGTPTAPAFRDHILTCLKSATAPDTPSTSECCLKNAGRSSIATTGTSRSPCGSVRVCLRNKIASPDAVLSILNCIMTCSAKHLFDIPHSWFETCAALGSVGAADAAEVTSTGCSGGWVSRCCAASWQAIRQAVQHTGTFAEMSLGAPSCPSGGTRRLVCRLRRRPSSGSTGGRSSGPRTLTPGAACRRLLIDVMSTLLK